VSAIRTAFLFAEKRVPGESRPDLGPQIPLDQPIGRRDDVERIALAGALRARGGIDRQLDRGRRPLQDGFERQFLRRRWIRQRSILPI
jgi:hypothetical protein